MLVYGVGGLGRGPGFRAAFLYVCVCLFASVCFVFLRFILVIA